MYNKYFKKMFDFLLALLLLPLFCIVLIVIGPVIFMEDKGSVFYKTKRLGKNQKTFEMYKFRSMKMNAPDLRNEDGSTFNSENDPRLTKVGRLIRKTSLDEIPQIINVLIGDMSFIGPRPDLPEAITLYDEKEIHKLDVKPGLTGYSQAYFRNSIIQSEKFKNDIYYVNNISLSLDVKIFILTILNVLRKRNINISLNKMEDSKFYTEEDLDFDSRKKSDFTGA